LSQIFRAQFKAGLKKLGLLDQGCPAWQQNWAVHTRQAGSGQTVLRYLARYVFRMALTNSRLEAFQNGQVTFRYRDNKTQQLRHLRLPAEQFIERFLQHILPKGFVKVRTYGLWSAAQQHRLAQVQDQLAPSSALPPLPPEDLSEPSADSPPEPPRCPHCKVGHMLFVREILPQRKRPP
jgi:hypothetical protein